MANGFAAGIAGGLEGLVEFLKYRQGQKRLDVEQQQRQAMLDRESRESQLRMEQVRQAMEVAKLQQKQAALALADQPRKTALDIFKTNVEAKGLEGALDDPQALNQATAAGITLPHQPYLKPTEGLSQNEADAGNELMGLFPRSGIVKPPEVVEAEALRRQKVLQAREISKWLSSMSGPPQGGGGVDPTSGFVDSPRGRMMMKLGMGVNPNDIFGPIRETPEEAAARAGAVAAAQAPYRKDLIDYAVQNGAPALAGDPYFNEALRVMAGIIPPVDERTAALVVNGAKAMAAAAQRVQPRGKPTGATAPPPPGGAPAPSSPMDSLLLQAKQTFGSWERVEVETQKPEVQARLKAAGIDPAAYLLKVKSYKILERANNATTPR